MLVRLLDGPSALAASAAAALALFACLLVPWRFAMLGGGDVKLLAAIGLRPAARRRRQPAHHDRAGRRRLGLAHLALRRLPRPKPPKPGAGLLLRVCAAERWRIVRHAPLPYAVAIAIGGLWTLTKFSGA